MKMQIKTSVTGEFAKVGKDIKDQDLVTILTEGEEHESEFGGKVRKQTIFKIRTPNGGDKNLGFNQQTINNLVHAYGDESSTWIGKRAKVWVVKAMIGGELKNITYLGAPDWEMDEKGRFYGPEANGNEIQIDGGEDREDLEGPFEESEGDQ